MADYGDNKEVISGECVDDSMGREEIIATEYFDGGVESNSKDEVFRTVLVVIDRSVGEGNIELIVGIEYLKASILFFVYHRRVLVVGLISLEPADNVISAVIEPVDSAALVGVHVISISGQEQVVVERRVNHLHKSMISTRFIRTDLLLGMQVVLLDSSHEVETDV